MVKKNKIISIYTKKSKEELKKFYKKKYSPKILIISFVGKENLKGFKYDVLMGF